MSFPTIARWKGRWALVTGASYGLGAEFCRALTREGIHVIGCGRSVDKIRALAAEIAQSGHEGRLKAYECDLTKETEIQAMFTWIGKLVDVGGVDVLVNNAGILDGESILSADPAKTKFMFDLNVLAVLSCDRLAVASMKARGVKDGHIFHINSVTGHTVHDWGGVHTYGATKWAITHINEALRQEVTGARLPIRVTSLSPGVTDTPLIDRFEDGVRKQIVEDMPSLVPRDVAGMLIFALSAPQHINIHELTVRATGSSI